MNSAVILLVLLLGAFTIPVHNDHQITPEWDMWFYDHEIYFFAVFYLDRSNANYARGYTCGDVRTCYGITV